jgi:superfamily II DNA or RNA helicase
MSDLELSGVFEDGEYGTRGVRTPRAWHIAASVCRDKSVSGHDAASGPHVFNIYAGTGAGKTDLAALCAAKDLNSGAVRRVVVCVPTNIIAERTREIFREHFGIHLAIFSARRHRNGVTSDQQGYIVTHSAVARCPAIHRRIARFEPTLVIIDEVHHLGEGESCGEAAKLAFGAVRRIITMTGSPFRPKGEGTIPFAVYEPTDRDDVLRYAADYSYTLGRAIIDGYCREPEFRFSEDVRVRIRPAGTDREFEVGFRDKVSDAIAQLRLKAAVQYGSCARRTFLAAALAAIKAAGRKVIIFLGGDTAESRTPTEDALHLLPAELDELGYGPEERVVITEKTKNPHAKLKEFRASAKAWILVTVNMVSEGADVPELSAAIFLTTWTSDLSVVQRIGRVLRYMGKGDHPDAWIYMFGHPAYEAVALSIKQEMAAEAAIRDRQRREGGDRSGDGPPRRTEAVAISGGKITHYVHNGDRYPATVFEPAVAMLQSRGLSMAFLEDTIRSMTRENDDVADGRDRRSA